MSRIAVFPGTFDPITRGHDDLVRRAVPMFDKLIIAIGDNSQKQHMFPLEKRMAWIQNVYKHIPEIEVNSYTGLTVDFCQKQGAGFIVRGLRNAADLAFESPIAQMNRELNSDIETVFLVTAPEWSALSSTIIRDIIRNKGDVSRFIPDGVDLHA